MITTNKQIIEILHTVNLNITYQPQKDYESCYWLNFDRMTYVPRTFCSTDFKNWPDKAV